MKYAITFLLLALGCFTAQSQTPERMKELADRYFDEYSYDRAVKFYEELPEKDSEVRRKLATSYVKLNQPEVAEGYLFDVINGEQFIAEDLFNYSQVLAMNKKKKNKTRLCQSFRANGVLRLLHPLSCRL